LHGSRRRSTVATPSAGGLSFIFNQVQLDGPVAAAAETDAADNAPTAAEPAHDEVADDEGGDDARVDEPQPAERS